MRYRRMYPAALCFAAFLAAIGLILDDPSNILPGLWKIMITEDALITDYMEIAGVGAAFVNSALVTLISIGILYLAKDPINGYTVVEIGLMAGFALFGKNIVNIWPTMGGMCIVFIAAGLFFCKRPVWAAWAGYRRLLQTTGRAPSDYLRMLGSAPVLINMGVNGLIGIVFILVTGGDLNGPTIGGIMTIIGFSAFGKHARNITPVMLGVVLGGLLLHQDLGAGAMQLAMLFGTTLAPVSGYFGWPFGIVAGFLHSAVVLYAGSPVSGLNLYNNGFSGGLIAIVLYPIITAAIRHRKPELQDEDYFDAFEHDTPTVPPPPGKEK